MHPSRCSCIRVIIRYHVDMNTLNKGQYKPFSKGIKWLNDKIMIELIYCTNFNVLKHFVLFIAVMLSWKRHDTILTNCFNV